jgi:F-type H+-transporting ATPase subunit epsilon
VTLHVELLMPDRELWSGEAGLVIAKTMDGDIGIQGGHAPVFGILSPGSVIRIREVPGDDNPGDVVRAAVRDGFLSVADGSKVSILASSAELSTEVDTAAAQEEMQAVAASEGSSAEESSEFRYARAKLHAAGEQA